jgi:putative phosphoesterase
MLSYKICTELDTECEYFKLISLVLTGFFYLQHRKAFTDKRKENIVNNMLIGLVSDSHDNLPLVEKAVRILNEQKVGLVLHAGDYVAPFVIAKFKKLNCRLIGVFGNNDGDHERLKKRFDDTTNCEVHDRFAQVVADGYKIALLHGDELDLLDAIIDGGYFNAVIHGHSHNRSVQRKGKTLAVNPGELCGYLTGKSSIAILDTLKDEARIVDLE